MCKKNSRHHILEIIFNRSQVIEYNLSLKVTIQDGPKYCIVLKYSFNMKLIYIIDQSGKIFFEFEKKNWANTFRRNCVIVLLFDTILQLILMHVELIENE